MNPSRDLHVIGIGAAAIAISPFLPWIHVFILGDLNLLSLLSAAHSSSAIGIGLTAIGIALLLGTYLSRNPHAIRSWAIAVGVAIGFIGVDVWVSLLRAVHASGGFASVGIGAVVATIGVALLLIGAMVGLNRETPAYRVRTSWQRGPALSVVGLFAALGVLGLAVPATASDGSGCGTPASAMWRHTSPLPDYRPPGVDQSQLQGDQNALTNAQGASGQASQAAAAAQAGADNAQTLTSNAQNAASEAASADSTVSGDEDNLSGANATVSGDQATIQADTAQLRNDQQLLATDQAAGYSTSTDQSDIAQDQATLARDQATLANDQATVNDDEAELQRDKAAAQAAHTKADALAGQAQAAQNQSDQQSAQAGAESSSAAQNLQQAQDKLSSDQANNSQTLAAYQSDFQEHTAAVQAANARTRSCVDASVPRASLGALALLGALGLAMRRMVVLRGANRGVF